jgi:hypothetical protein
LRLCSFSRRYSAYFLAVVTSFCFFCCIWGPPVVIAAALRAQSAARPAL